MPEAELGQGHVPDVGAITWRRSSRCSNSGCVDVARTDDAILVRDSKDPDGAILRFTSEEFAAFLEGVMNGEFDDLRGLTPPTTPVHGAA